MNAPTRSLLAAALITAAGNTALPAQILHVNDRWEECAIVFHPMLTQDAFHQFVSELAQVAYFRPLASARPLGAKRFEFALLNWATKIDDADDAWNHTFSHPDSTHWLFDGDALPIPGMMLRAGVTDRVDVGAYFTKNFRSNYGFVGGQVQYNLVNDTQRHLAAAGRLSVVSLFGPEDVSAGVVGLDFLVSSDLSVVSPYAGVSTYLSHGRERAHNVDLETENVFGVQGMVGATAKIYFVRLGAELSLAKVPGYAFKVAFGS